MLEKENSDCPNDVKKWLYQLNSAYKTKDDVDFYDRYREEEMEQWQVEPRPVAEGPDWELYTYDDPGYESEEDLKEKEKKLEQSDLDEMFGIKKENKIEESENSKENAEKRKNQIAEKHIEARNVWMDYMIYHVSCDTSFEERRGFEMFVKDTQAFFALFKKIDCDAYEKFLAEYKERR